jgi:hypothetical protein
MERTVMRMVLDEAARMYERDEQGRMSQLRNAVQEGVIRAFGGK